MSANEKICYYTISNYTNLDNLINELSYLRTEILKSGEVFAREAFLYINKYDIYIEYKRPLTKEELEEHARVENEAKESRRKYYEFLKKEFNPE